MIRLSAVSTEVTRIIRKGELNESWDAGESVKFIHRRDCNAYRPLGSDYKLSVSDNDTLVAKREEARLVFVAAWIYISARSGLTSTAECMC